MSSFLHKKNAKVGILLVLMVLAFLGGMSFQKYLASKSILLPSSIQIDTQVRQKSVIGIVTSVSSSILTLDTDGSGVYELLVIEEVRISGNRNSVSINQLLGKKVVAYYSSTTDGRKVLRRVNVIDNQ